MVYKEAFLFPYTIIKDFLLATFFLGLPFINVITGFFFFGYLVHVSKEVLEHHEQLPPWTRMWHLFVDGIKVFLISLVYSIPLLVSVLVARYSPTVGMVLMIIFGLLALLLVPTAIIRFAREEQLGAAFQIGPVVKIAFSLKMLLSWLVVLLFVIAYGALTFILSLLTFITYVGPYIFIALAITAVMLSSFALFASAYAEKELFVS